MQHKFWFASVRNSYSSWSHYTAHLVKTLNSNHPRTGVSRPVKFTHLNVFLFNLKYYLSVTVYLQQTVCNITKSQVPGYKNISKQYFNIYSLSIC